MTDRAAAHGRPITESLPALRRAGLLPPVEIALVIVLSFTQDPAPSLSGYDPKGHASPSATTDKRRPAPCS